MATLSLRSDYESSLTWTISGLSVDFNTTNYLTVGITTNVFSNNATSISGIVDRVAPRTDFGTSRSVTNTITMNPGTYRLYGFTRLPAGTKDDGTPFPAYYYIVNTTPVSVTVQGPPAPVWPGDFTFRTLGSTIVSVTADEWNSFLDRVNEVREYLSMTAISFTNYRASYKGTMLASTYNYVARTVNNMCSRVSSPYSVATVSSDTLMRKSQFTNLADALNSCR